MIPILISEGDPSGISYEILDKSYLVLKKISKKKQIILISSQNQIKPKQFKEYKKFEFQNSAGIYFYQKNLIKNKFLISKPSIYSGKISYNSLMTTIELQKKIGGNLITLPLSKEWVIRSGVKNFSGHTETLANEYNKKTFMLMYSNTLKVLTLTTHVPLVEVPKYLKKFDTNEFIQAVKKLDLKNKKIGLCGFNPHAGENGKIGSEEKEILFPFINKLKKAGFDISDPISADSLFIPEISSKFGMILACYHDQGLIPFKSLVGKKGVNMTLGLDFIRVSPDHGPAFDIAGKNLASAESFVECLKVIG